MSYVGLCTCGYECVCAHVSEYVCPHVCRAWVYFSVHLCGCALSGYMCEYMTACAVYEYVQMCARVSAHIHLCTCECTHGY